MLRGRRALRTAAPPAAGQRQQCNHHGGHVKAFACALRMAYGLIRQCPGTIASSKGALSGGWSDRVVGAKHCRKVCHKMEVLGWEIHQTSVTNIQSLFSCTLLQTFVCTVVISTRPILCKLCLKEQLLAHEHTCV